MGAGKTTLGRALAERAAVAFMDVDAEIEAADGRTIVEIFAEEGEEAFRAIEGCVLRELDLPAEFVVATGGGVPVEPEQRAWLRDRGTIVWVDVPFEELERRLAGDATRPLWRDPGRARELLEARRESYADCDVHFEPGDVSIADTVDLLLERLSKPA